MEPGQLEYQVTVGLPGLRGLATRAIAVAGCASSVPRKASLPTSAPASSGWECIPPMSSTAYSIIAEIRRSSVALCSGPEGVLPWSGNASEGIEWAACIEGR